MAESLEGQILLEVHKSTGLMPSDILAQKYTPDIRLLWRLHYVKLKREADAYDQEDDF